MSNRFESFRPLMFKEEYKLIEKYLNKDDVFLEWGSGHSTIYYCDMVKEIISIEHDIDWINNINTVIDTYNIKNVTIHHVLANSPNPIPCRYEQFKDYIEYVKNNNFKFNKVLIDGRARKYCAKSIYDIIDENVLVFIHDFNRPDYQKTLKYYDIVEQVTSGQGLAVLKKKKVVIEDGNYY